MTRMIREFLRDEKGQTFALMAVMVAGIVGFIALGIDYSMLAVAHREAQRAAESAALAGAQEFMNITPALAAAGPARDSAMVYARKNAIRNVLIDSSEVSILVEPDSQKVSVRIERVNIPLWFARLLGRQFATVNAHAAAHAAEAGAATCVAPWAVPDIWGEGAAGDDTNGNGLWDLTESWVYADDVGDVYNTFGSGTAPETGYGSSYRNWTGTIIDDYGREMILKVQDPNNAPTSGFFYPFRIGTSQGADDYRDAIAGCNPEIVPLNSPVPLEMGNMVGPTRQGVDDVVAMDPTAYWDNTTNNLISPYGFSSPRVKIVPLYDPAYIAQIVGGNHTLTFNNFALIFIEGTYSVGPDEFVVGRFLYFAQGVGGGAPGGITGSLVRVLQLVE